MTPLKAINVFLLQWFFIRLTSLKERVIEDFQIHSFSVSQHGFVSSRGTGEYKIYQYYVLEFWIVPCTGWWNNFKYLNGDGNFTQITKKSLASG